MMSRTGDLVLVMLGLLALLAGLGSGWTWAGAFLMLVGVAILGRAGARAFLRARDVGAP